MGFDHKKIRRVVEDRLSSLPDELIHKIMSCLDMKFVVQTSSLSSRWKLVWTSIPCLNFSADHFGTLRKFAGFVTHVLSHRNHEIEVSSVKLNFHGSASHDFVKKIAKYAFSHNVQELSVISWPKKRYGNYPPCLFNSGSLKHFTLNNCYMSGSIIPKTPWNFPALETLHLTHIRFRWCGDLFSKCVNLKNLTLKCFFVVGEVFDIITPRLSNLVLTNGSYINVINLIAPQLVNLTIINCSIEYLNAPPGLSSLCYSGYPPLQFSKDGFHSLNKVDITLTAYWCSNKPYKAPYKKEDARNTINMLQELHSARNLTLNVNIVECISSFPNLLSHHPSSFSNLICLTIDDSMKKVGYKEKMSSKALNFFLENSPSAMFIKGSPKVQVQSTR